MSGNFLETALDALREVGADFRVTELAYSQPGLLTVEGTKGKARAKRLGRKCDEAVYHGEFGKTCPDCETRIGKRHRKACSFGLKSEPVTSTTPNVSAEIEAS